ncbi:MAG: hypothetical protein AB1656_20560 [Candidatus Omnitrophota bacterium]
MFLLWATVFVVYLGLRSHTFFSSLVHDDGLFLYAGQALANGELPYEGFWDHKPPCIFFFHSIPFYFFPFSLAAAKLHEILWLSFAALLLFYFCQRRFHRLTAFAALFFFVFCTSLHYTVRSGGLTEETALFFVVLCYWQILRRRGKLGVNAFIAGLALGAAIEFRQTFVFTSVFLVGALLHNAHQRDKKFKDVLGPFFAMCAGLAIPEILISSYFWIHGGWRDYFEASYLFNLHYIGPARAKKPLAEILRIQWEFIQCAGPYLYSPFLTLCTWRWIPTTARWMTLPLILAFLGDMVAVSLSGEFYCHYYVQAAVSTTLLLAMFVEGFIEKTKDVRTQGFIALASLGYAGFGIILLLLVAVPLYSASLRYLSDYRQILAERNSPLNEYQMQQSAAQAAKRLTAPDETILLLGQSPNSVYIYSGRYAGSRYYHYSPIWKLKLRDALKERHIKLFMEDIQARKPVILFVDLKLPELRELREMDLLEESRLDFLPGFKQYLFDNYIALEAIWDNIPSEWFWYDVRNIILVRKDKVEEIKARIQRTSDAAAEK